MSKRTIALVVAAAAVLGTAGAAFAAANPPERASYGLEEAALSLAADPAPPAPATPEADNARREQLKACVTPKVDAGTPKREARRQCAEQLGVRDDMSGKAARAARNGRPAQDRRPRLRGAAHAELVVPKRDAPGQWETIVVDRGKVTAASADSISVQRPDGPTVTLRVVPATRVRGAEKVADLAPGREVAVVSAGGEARSVVARR